MAVLISHTGPIERGIVRKVRQIEELKEALRKTKGGGIHEDFAPVTVRYPFFTYSLVSAPVVQDWGTEDDEGTREIHAIYDLIFWARSKPEAASLDSILDGNLQRKEDLEVEGQTVIHLQRIGSAAANGADADGRGRRYSRVGGSYEIWTTQPIPKPILGP